MGVAWSDFSFLKITLSGDFEDSFDEGGTNSMI